MGFRVPAVDQSDCINYDLTLSTSGPGSLEDLLLWALVFRIEGCGCFMCLAIILAYQHSDLAPTWEVVLSQ